MKLIYLNQGIKKYLEEMSMNDYGYFMTVDKYLSINILITVSKPSADSGQKVINVNLITNDFYAQIR